jgi:putative toxin-antitoxin system antitoxin component (TIGR02293 family)
MATTQVQKSAGVKKGGVVVPKTTKSDPIKAASKPSALRSDFVIVYAKNTHRHMYSSSHGFHFLEIYCAARPERLELIKAGIPANTVTLLADKLHTSKERLMTTLGFSRSTIMRRIQNNQDLSMDQAERVVGLAKLVGQVQKMIAESGDATGFDAAQWVSEWLESNNPALGNRKPAEYMDTGEGQEIVSSLLAQMQSGAYA